MLQFTGWQSVGFDLATAQQQNPDKVLKNLCVLSRSQPTLGHPIVCSLPGFSVHGIIQARIMEGPQKACNKIG